MLHQTFEEIGVHGHVLSHSPGFIVVSFSFLLLSFPFFSFQVLSIVLSISFHVPLIFLSFPLNFSSFSLHCPLSLLLFSLRFFFLFRSIFLFLYLHVLSFSFHFLSCSYHFPFVPLHLLSLFFQFLFISPSFPLHFLSFSCQFLFISLSFPFHVPFISFIFLSFPFIFPSFCFTSCDFQSLRLFFHVRSLRFQISPSGSHLYNCLILLFACLQTANLGHSRLISGCVQVRYNTACQIVGWHSNSLFAISQEEPGPGQVRATSNVWRNWCLREAF